MQRAYVTLGIVSATVGGAIFYVHNKKFADRARMHQGVLRDIAKERAEEEAAAAARECENGVCDLAQTRFRDPVTGAVYTQAADAPAALK